MVRDLPAEVAVGGVSAIGLLVGSELRGVAAWRLYPSSPFARSDIVAVKVGHQGKGYGRQLKQAVLSAAREAGALVLVSLVDRRNTQMIGLNLKLGGVIERLNDDDENVRCFFALQ